MADAPKRIWASAARPGYGEWQDIPCGLPSPHEYHLARPGQPCSTDEFLGKVMAWGDPCYYSGGMLYKIDKWLSGDFTAAMEGLE